MMALQVDLLGSGSRSSELCHTPGGQSSRFTKACILCPFFNKDLYFDGGWRSPGKIRTHEATHFVPRFR